jgi:hypothetical protein
MDRVHLVWLLAPAVACSPFPNGYFDCTSSAQCTGGPGAGTCQPTGFCSFGDSSCTSGQRYGSLSGSYANTCVGEEMNDAGVFHDAKVFDDAKISMDGPVCYGAANDLVRPCFGKALTGSVTLSGAIDTATSAMCSTTVMNVTGMCVIAAGTVTITGGTLTATGALPLVIVGGTSITVNSEIDVSSHSGSATGFATAQVGAGSIATNDATDCNPGTLPNAHIGGAGGSFGTIGGKGGNSTGGHGAAGAVVTPTTLRGGCYGQSGSGGTPGVQGVGGGALALIAGSTITVTANIDASGASGTGGTGGGNGGGGAGAGTGGMIIFDATTVTNGVAIFANGAGGGGGGDTTHNNESGTAGNESQNATTAASGGTQGGNGGAGGAGAVQGTAAANGAAGGGGGGGGGGGDGIIRIFTATSITGGTVSPTPQ